MFWKKKEDTAPRFDKTGKVPTIRSSICTGEQVAGFRRESDGRFEEIMCIRSDADLAEFLRLYGVREEEVKREW